MTSNPIGRLALLWRAIPKPAGRRHLKNNRWHQVFAALATENIHAEPAVYCEERADELRAQLLSCGDGAVDVWQQAAPYRRLVLLETVSGARTSLFVPELDRLFVAARAGYFRLGSDATLSRAATD